MRGVVLLLGITALAVQSDTRAAQTPIDEFNGGVSAYVALHRQVERYLPPQQNFTTAEEGLAYAAALRRALCAVRPDAREGDVFASAAGEFRGRIRSALRRHGVEPRDLVLAMIDDTEPGALPPVVNAAFSWALGNVMPSFLIDVLPALPDELQYRFVGSSLVLIDIHAGLVVDILRSALLVETSARRIE
jgi:hypothetical protein